MVHYGTRIMSHIYDAEFHPLIYSSPQPSFCRRWIKFFIYIAIMICMISFTIVDLIYGCMPDKCIADNIESIPISLSGWLQISGVIGCIILVFAISFGCCWTLSPNIHIIINIIPLILMFSWLIVGNVVYWRGYYNNNTCADSLITYVMIRFYVGFIITIIAVYHEIKSSD